MTENDMNFRSDKLQKLAHREWLRKNMPPSSDGFVVEDLDLVIRWYGDNFGLDGNGAFMLIELKYGRSWIETSQGKLFGMMHSLLRKADPNQERYMGYFVVQYDNEDWSVANFRINKKNVSRDEFYEFLIMRNIPKSWFE